MDVELLEAIYRNHPSSEKSNFLATCYAIMGRCGMVKGFRKNSWWNNTLCRRQLAQLFTDNKMAFRSLLKEQSFSDFLKVHKDFPKTCRETSDYFHKNYGAPQFTPDDVKADYADAVVTKAFDAWLADYCQKNEPTEDFRKHFPRILSSVRIFNILSQSGDSTYEDTCRRIWQKLGPIYKAIPDYVTVRRDFPIPDDLKAQFGLPDDVVKTPTEAATQTADAAAEVRLGVALSTLADVKAAAERYREHRNAASAAAFGQQLTDKGWFAAAADLYYQGTFLADDAERENMAASYLIALLKRDGGTEQIKAEIKTFEACFPTSERISEISDELKRSKAPSQKAEKAAEHGRIALWRTWTAENSIDGLAHAAGLKHFREHVNELMTSDQPQALEFLHESLRIKAWFSTDERVSVLYQLSEVQQALKLTVPASLTLAEIAETAAEEKRRTDAWSRLVVCLTDDGRWREAEAAVEKMGAAGVPHDVVEAAQLRLGAAKGKQTDRTSETEGTARARFAPSQTRPDLEHLPYPRRYIGVIGRQNNYINFSAKYVATDHGWTALTRDEQAFLFPRRGWLALRFANTAMASALKDGRLVVLEENFGEVTPTEDYDYMKRLEPQIGRQIQFLSALGAVVVTPETKAFDLTADTYVTADETGKNDAVFDGEEAVIAVKGGFVGPFRLRADMNHRLYVPRLTANEAAAVTLWVPKFADSVLDLAMETPESTVKCRVATVADSTAFEKRTTDALTDAALLTAAARSIPALSDIADMASVLDDVELLKAPERREKVRTLLADWAAGRRFTADVRKTAVGALLDVLKAEETAEVRPVTAAVMTAVAQTPELTALNEKLGKERRAIEEGHRTALEAEAKEYEQLRAATKARIAELAADLTAAETEAEKKKAFWSSELKAMVATAKAEIVRFRALPELNIGGSAPTERPAVKPAKSENPDYCSRMSALWTLPTVSGTTSGIRRRLIEDFQARRGYTHDETVNLFLSVANNFLTVFSGEPGCGKTSVCSVIAETMGLVHLEKKLAETSAWSGDRCDRFLTVPVERGWTSKRDFLGYFNPLTQSFSTNDRRRYDAFRLLDIEAGTAERPLLPFIFLLDEANLSPMEYYWADFMRICGGDEQSDKDIVLADNLVCRIPDHLRFLATINIDDTTEPLSPRLLDRAWIVRLPQPDFTAAQKALAAADSVTWKDFVTAFGGHDRAAEPKELKPFYDVLHSLGMNVSMRSRRAMAKFVSIGASLFDGGRTTAVDYAVAQKILPMVKGSGPQFRERLEELLALAANYPVTEGIVREILVRGDRNLNFYQFF